jgi:hypothetical protein
MNPINLRILYLDGNEKEVKAVAADLIAFESRFDLSVARLAQEVRLTHMFYIAWHVEHRTKSTDLDFEQWTETVELVAEGEVKK